jgi:hypothetical protein
MRIFGLLRKPGLLLPLVAALAFAAGSAVVAYADTPPAQIYACVNTAAAPSTSSTRRAPATTR